MSSTHFHFTFQNITTEPYSFDAFPETKKREEETFQLTKKLTEELSLESLANAFGISAKLIKVSSHVILSEIDGWENLKIHATQEDPYRWSFHWFQNNDLKIQLELDAATDFSLGC